MNMKKLFTHFLTFAAICMLSLGCSNGSNFVGTKVTNANDFCLTYSTLNEMQSGALALSEGDILTVELENESGMVDLTVQIEGNAPIYTGTSLQTTSFALNIDQTGVYRINVTGHAASGSAVFTRSTPEVPETEQLTSSTQMLEAYQFALEQIAFEHVYPDGQDTGFDGSFGFIEENQFAIYDVNGDGVEELIVCLTTVPMAGNIEKVYTYTAQGELCELVSVFPATTYYANGILKAEWSHSSGLAEDSYWPFSLYRFDATTGECTCIAEVDMWSRSVDTVNYKGDPYPDEIDIEQAGTVFILTRDEKTETVSKSTYDAYLSDILQDSAVLTIPYQAMSEDNIKNLVP